MLTTCVLKTSRREHLRVIYLLQNERLLKEGPYMEDYVVLPTRPGIRRERERESLGWKGHQLQVVYE